MMENPPGGDPSQGKKDPSSNQGERFDPAKTGDEFRALLWIRVAVVCGVGSAAVILYLIIRRAKKQKDV